MATTQGAPYRNYIGGQWVDSVSGRTYPVANPAHKGTILGEFQTSTPEDALKAVAAAKEALEGWANTPAPARAQVLFRALEIMGRRSDELARTITEEEGKPLPDAQGEVRRAMNIIEYAAGEGRRMFGYTTPSELPEHGGLHRAEAAGSGSHHHTLELPHRHSRLEDGARPYLRQRPYLQAGLHHAA